MNVTLLALGTRGDIQPFLALGQGLRRRGHSVTLAGPVNFHSAAEGAGIAYAPLRADYQAMMESAQGRGALAGNPLAIASAMREMRAIVRDLLAETWEAARGADILVYHPKALVGADLAEAMDIPCFLALPVPLMAPTGAFPAPGTSSRNLGTFLNRATYRAALSATLPFQDIISRWRKESLKLPPRSRFGNPFEVHGEPLPLLYAFSRHVVPPPPDWADNVYVTGYWFLNGESEWRPPAALRDFLEAGEPPVYVGFGSMVGGDPARSSALVQDALVAAGVRGIVATGWGGLTDTTTRAEIFMLEAAPHEWLFPRCAAVVHHGGAGTVAAGLRAGRPTVVCPYFGDQPFWGQRVHELGAGPAPLPQKTLTPDRLARAIREATTREAYRENAARLGEAIRAEDGVARAVEIIEASLRGR